MFKIVICNCSKCSKDAKWIRYKNNFCNATGFCEQHAKQEEDFKEDSIIWKKISDCGIDNINLPD